MKKKKLLWIGDACCDSGFARATHNTLPGLIEAGFEVGVLGLNYLGDPHPWPYPIWPCWPGKDMFGIGRLADEHGDGVVQKFRPDVIVIQNDPWNIPLYMNVLRHSGVPVVGSIAVDGLNCRGGDAKNEDPAERGLNDLALALFWTEFGRAEAVKGGCEVPTGVVPLGVDLSVYSPGDMAEARKACGWPVGPEAFVVGNVNRNQPRKRLDLTLRYFAEWIRSEKIDDAYLFLHVAPTGESSYDVKQFAKYYGLTGKVMLSEPGAYKGLPETTLALLYRCFSAMMSTTQGEGMGLTTLEGMACGVAQAVPDWSALGDWAKGAAHLVPCTSTAATTNGINVVGGIADQEFFVRGLDMLYRDAETRKAYVDAGLALVARPEYRWENIGRAFAKAVVDGVFGGLL